DRRDRSQNRTDLVEGQEGLFRGRPTRPYRIRGRGCRWIRSTDEGDGGRDSKGTLLSWLEPNRFHQGPQRHLAGAHRAKELEPPREHCPGAEPSLILITGLKRRTSSTGSSHRSCSRAR